MSPIFPGRSASSKRSTHNTEGSRQDRREPSVFVKKVRISNRRGRRPRRPGGKIPCDFDAFGEFATFPSGSSRGPTPTYRFLNSPDWWEPFLHSYRLLPYTYPTLFSGSIIFCFMNSRFFWNFLPQRDSRAQTVDKSAVSIKYCTVVSQYFVDIFSCFLLDFNNPKC